MPIQQMQSDGGLADITKLLELVKDQKSTSSTSTNITQAGVQQQINEILGANNGLAAVAGGQHAAGFYNSSVNTQMINDLLTRSAATVAARNATTTQTNTKKAPLSAKDVLTTIGGLALKNPGKLKSLYQTVHDQLYGPNAVSDSVTPVSTVGNSELTADLSGNLNEAIASGTDLNVTATGGTSDNVTEALSNLFNDAGYDAAATDATTSALGSESVDALPAGYADSAVADTIPDAIATDGTTTAAGADAVGAESSGGFSGTAAAGWGALAVASAIDANSTQQGGSTSAKNFLDYTGDLGTSDVIRGLDSGKITDSVNPLGQELLDKTGLSDTLNDVGKSTGWIICTELLKQKRLPKEYYVPGLRVFQAYRLDLLDGYYIWARPTVRLLIEKPFCLRSRFISYIFNARAEYLASCAGVKNARNLLTGQVISAFVYGFCYVIGQYLKHTRNAKEGEFA